MALINPNAWHNFYHCIGSTYGTWLRGDRRGFRTHQHRQHVQGDYKQPPPQGLFEPIFEYSKQTLKHPPVKLTSQQRKILCHALIQQLQDDHAQPIVLAIAENHFHLLARFPELNSDQHTTHKTHLI
ncbi:MAG: hypothetical protein JKX85_12955 [Phycisphaeraceae bacterium]|nr:hypothetical protein [Phycisphaeraceae bacterium]